MSAPAAASSPGNTDLMDQAAAVAALSALAQDTRLSVFRLLVQAGEGGVSAGGIAERLDVRQNTLSTHLGILVAAGLVTKRRDGRTIYYAAAYPGMRALLTYLLEDCCGGRPELCSTPLSSC
tara:strand:- start:864 stop:1229 length:366 start_codon:yes stop_codon:yes gene_type:complete